MQPQLDSPMPETIQPSNGVQSSSEPHDLSLKGYALTALFFILVAVSLGLVSLRFFERHLQSVREVAAYNQAPKCGNSEHANPCWAEEPARVSYFSLNNGSKYDLNYLQVSASTGTIGTLTSTPNPPFQPYLGQPVTAIMLGGNLIGISDVQGRTVYDDSSPQYSQGNELAGAIVTGTFATISLTLAVAVIIGGAAMVRKLKADNYTAGKV